MSTSSMYLAIRTEWPGHRDAIAKGVKGVGLQVGITNDKGLERARQAASWLHRTVARWSSIGTK